MFVLEINGCYCIPLERDLEHANLQGQVGRDINVWL
jgi:hypothetical protein